MKKRLLKKRLKKACETIYPLSDMIQAMAYLDVISNLDWWTFKSSGLNTLYDRWVKQR
jgi:hypothetical protein